MNTPKSVSRFRGVICLNEMASLSHTEHIYITPDKRKYAIGDEVEQWFFGY